MIYEIECGLLFTDDVENGKAHENEDLLLSKDGTKDSLKTDPRSKKLFEKFRYLSSFFRNSEYVVNLIERMNTHN